MFNKQITFQAPMTCTHVYQDGSKERVRYGQYESILITHENGLVAGGNRTLAVPYYYVEEVTKIDGTVVVFDKPFYLINVQEYGDGSGRIAKDCHTL